MNVLAARSSARMCRTVQLFDAQVNEPRLELRLPLAHAAHAAAGSTQKLEHCVDITNADSTRGSSPVRQNARTSSESMCRVRNTRGKETSRARF